ncbi:MAG TPA: DUF6443 domain-containing protein, partial [Hymenobacter sp.]|nr:DUF6443 domain-containing protein [Hymenobacter sp.]
MGPGSLTLTIQNYDPTYTYTWYEAASGSAIVSSSSGPTFTTPALSQSRSYYLGITACQEYSRQEVPIIIRQVQILIGGVAPTRPVPLRYGSGLTLEAFPANRGPYTWLLNGQPVAGATGSQLTVFEAGSYVVRASGGTGPDYESVPVEVLDALAGQTANNQALSYVNEITVLKPGLTNPQDVVKLSPAERQQTVTYANSLGQPVQQLAVQAGPAQQDIVQHISYEGTSTTTQTFLPFPVAAVSKATAEYEADPTGKVNSYYSAKGGQPY